MHFSTFSNECFLVRSEDAAKPGVKIYATVTMATSAIADDRTAFAACNPQSTCGLSRRRGVGGGVGGGIPSCLPPVAKSQSSSCLRPPPPSLTRLRHAPSPVSQKENPTKLHSKHICKASIFLNSAICKASIFLNCFGRYDTFFYRYIQTTSLYSRFSIYFQPLTYSKRRSKSYIVQDDKRIDFFQQRQDSGFVRGGGRWLRLCLASPTPTHPFPRTSAGLGNYLLHADPAVNTGRRFRPGSSSTICGVRCLASHLTKLTTETRRAPESERWPYNKLRYSL